jgi:hypothetical protein
MIWGGTFLTLVDSVDRGYHKRWWFVTGLRFAKLLMIILVFLFIILLYFWLSFNRNGPYSDLMIDEVAHEREAVSVLQGTDPRLFQTLGWLSKNTPKRALYIVYIYRPRGGSFFGPPGQSGGLVRQTPGRGGSWSLTPGQRGVMFDRPSIGGGSCHHDHRAVDQPIDDHRSVIDRHHQHFENVQIMFWTFQKVDVAFSTFIKSVFTFFKKVEKVQKVQNAQLGVLDQKESCKCGWIPMIPPLKHF